jgi:hypothetical protein
MTSIPLIPIYGIFKIDIVFLEITGGAYQKKLNKHPSKKSLTNRRYEY